MGDELRATSFSDIELRRIIADLWPDRTGRHLADEEMAYLADLTWTSPTSSCAARPRPDEPPGTARLCLDDLARLIALCRAAAIAPPSPRPRPSPRPISPSSRPNGSRGAGRTSSCAR